MEILKLDYPVGAVEKNAPANSGDSWDGKIPWKMK